jgi:hypothetical protein
MSKLGFETVGVIFRFGFRTLQSMDLGGKRKETYPKPPHFRPAIKILISGSSLNLRIALVRLSRLKSPDR